MGSVWIADHLTLRSQVVVKFMADDLARRADAVERFSREAAAAFSVRHPNVVQMLDHGVTDGTPFIVMELLEGEDLSKRIARGVLPPLEVVRIVAETGKALDRMHERGVVHRDIKPENIFLTEVGGTERFVKVLDFGIAKQADALGSTQTGAMIGTPYYMSPEQMSGRHDLDGRTDLWSLAVVAFQALTGRRPFDGETLGQVAIAVNMDQLPTMRAYNPALPVGVDAWFARACARDRTLRFPTGRAMAEALEAVLQPRAARTQYAEPTPLPDSAPRTEPVVIIATPPPAEQVQVQRAPVHIPQYVEEDDDEPEPRSLRWVFWLVLLLAIAGGGFWLHENPWAIDQALEMLRH
jgi:eukaryotic-like serine/threonine-protein kinase